MMADLPRGRIGFVSTRIAGTDGVSLEIAKWAHVIERMATTIGGAPDLLWRR